MENTMKIALICPLGKDQTRMAIPPYGLAALAQYYKCYGRHSSSVVFKIFDENGEGRDLLPDIIRWTPDIVGIGTMSLTKERAWKMARRLRQQLPNIKLIGGGVHHQIKPEEGIEEGLFDFVCYGEGEQTVLCLLDDYLLSGCSEQVLYKIPNLVFRESSGRIIKTVLQELPDINKVPLPDLSLFNTNYYLAKRQFVPTIMAKSANIMTSRGCPFRCSYCFNSFRQGHVRYYKVEAVVKYIAGIRNRYGIDHFGLLDDLFLMDAQRVLEFCDLMLKHVPNAKWGCNARPNLVTEKMRPVLKAMREAGCIIMAFGFESGSDEVLQRVRGAGSSVEANQRAIDMMNEAGISIFGYFMCGLPDETREQMAMTEAFIRKNLHKLNHYDLFFFTPFPGSVLSRQVEEQGMLAGVTMSDLALNIFGEGRPRIFNRLVPAKEVIAFRKRIKRLVMEKHTLADKLRWLIMEALDNPRRMVRKLWALYGP